MKYMHMIFRERDHSEGRGWGSKAVGNFPENSSVLLQSPVPMRTDGVTKTDEHFQRGEGEGFKIAFQSVS